MLHPARISWINGLKQPVSKDSSFQTKVVVKCWLLFHSVSVHKLVQVVSSRFGVRFCPTLMRRISARLIATVDLSTCLYSTGAARAAEPVASLRRNSRNQAIALRTWHGSIFEKHNKDTQKTDASEGARWKMKSAGTCCEDEHRTNIRGCATAAAAQVKKLLFLCRKIRQLCPCQHGLYCIECIMNVYTRPNRNDVISHPCTQQS